MVMKGLDDASGSQAGNSAVMRKRVEDSQLLSNVRLAELCRRENELFKHEQVNDERFCLELIRRAVRRVEGADVLVYEIYHPWLERKIARRCPHEDPDTIHDLAQDALVRFFQYITAETLAHFDSLGQLLSYLIKCGETAIMVYYRRQERQRRIHHAFAEATAHHQPEQMEDRLAGHQLHQQLWECIRRNCGDEEDFLMAEQLWLFGQKPADIAHHFPQQFTQVADIYKRKRNLLDRIKRDAACRGLWDTL